MAEYVPYRKHVRSGDLLAWSTSKTASLGDLMVKAIRVFTMSEYNHVGIAWRMGDRLMVIEAVPPEVRIYPLSKLTPFYHVDMDIDWKSEYDDLLLDYVGLEYSTWQALISYFRKPDVDNKLQCVELALDFYKNAGIELVCDYTPAGIVEACLERSGTGLHLVRP